MDSESSMVSKFRKFGCLAFFLIQGQKAVGKLKPRWTPGVFVGFSSQIYAANSAYVVGYWATCERSAVGFRFATCETREVRFKEDQLISSLDLLKPNSSEYGLFYREGPAGQGNLDRRDPNRDQDTVRNSNTSTFKNELSGIEIEGEDDEEIDCEMCENFADSGPGPDGFGSEEQAADSGKQDTSAESAEDSGEQEAPVRNETSENRPEKRSRGRSRGSKDKKQRKRRGKPKTKEENIACINAMLGMQEASPQVPDDPITHTEVTLMLSVASALKSADSKEWDAAISLELARHEQFQTWRPLTTDAELAAVNEPLVPIAFILDVKRSGRKKYRAVLLGHFVGRAMSSGATVAPVVSAAGSRLLLTEAASDGDHLVIYDNHTAFLNAKINNGQDLNVLLPGCYAENLGYHKVRLFKVLYGRPEVPRAWHDEIRNFMVETGWSRCVAEPGLWKRPSVACPGKFLKQSIYVDDNCLAGPNKAEVDKTVKQFLERFPGDVIQPRLIDGFEVYDYLRADLYYFAPLRSFRLTLESYITKFAKKFGFTCTKPVFSTAFSDRA